MNSKREILLVATVFCASCAVAAELPSSDVPTIPGCGEKIKTSASFSDGNLSLWINGEKVPGTGRHSYQDRGTHYANVSGRENRFTVKTTR